MRYAIVYSSQTGNTALLARRIRATLGLEDCQSFGEPGAETPTADLLFVGFWTDKGTCDEKTAAFLARLSKKRVFLFGTAGFGGSEAYFKQILDRVRSLLPAGNEVVGSFMCQGRMPASVRDRYEKLLIDFPDQQRYQMLIKNYDLALPHPDADDLRRLDGAVAPLL